MSNLIQRWRSAGHIHLIWPLLACVAGWRFIILHFNDPVQWDPQYVYLPVARAFLQQGWSFLLAPPSCCVASLGYLWPALWGADPTWIRGANMALWACCVWFLWRASWLAGSWRAGMVAMLLLSYSDLIRYFPSELTEPIYLFGVFGLIHALARLTAGRERTFGAVAQGAVMLTITLLSRPILQLIAPTALLACLAALALQAMRNKGRPEDTHGGWPATVSHIAFSLGLGLLLPLALVVKNGLVFGLWGLGTGSGVGFYLGTHPLFQGTEPAFLGFNYDANRLITIVAGNPDTLSLAGDRVQRAAGLWQLQTMSAGDAVAFFSRKLWWWLAHHPAELQRTDSPIRQLRLFAFSTIAVTAMLAWRGWRGLRGRTTNVRSYTAAMVNGSAPEQWALAALLLGMFVLLVGQLLPILYNGRYGVALLDPWLLPLIAFCIARITAPIQLHGGVQKNWRGITITVPQGRMILAAIVSLAAIAAITSVTYNLARRSEHVFIDPQHMGQVATHLSITDSARIDTAGMVRLGEREWSTTESPAVFMVRLDQTDVERIGRADPFNALWDTEIALRSTTAGQKQKTCRKAYVAYQTATGAILQPAYSLPLALPLSVDGKFHHLVTHANAELRPGEAGNLRIELACQAGTVVEWRQTRFLESRHAWDAAAHIKP